MILSNREIYIYFFHNLIRGRLITIARAADSIKEKTSTLLKCYFSRFQEFVAACLIRICRFPLAMHVCSRNYVATYLRMDARRSVNVCFADYVRRLRVVSRFLARIMWDNRSDALKFKSPMANDKTAYISPGISCRNSRRDKKINYATNTYLLINSDARAAGY